LSSASYYRNGDEKEAREERSAEEGRVLGVKPDPEKRTYF
jgi:hypothetical protein